MAQLINDLKARLEKERTELKQKAGKGVMFSETGPVGIGLIEEMLKVIETQQAEITRLQNRLGPMESRHIAGGL